MNISFYKGCYNRNVTIKGENQDIFLLDGWDADKEEWDKNLPLLKEVLIQMTKDLVSRRPGELQTIYRYYVESDFKEVDYDHPVQENESEVLSRVLSYLENYDLNKESYSLHSFVEMIEHYLSSYAQNNEEDKTYSCEQCGDTNYGYSVEFSL